MDFIKPATPFEKEVWRVKEAMRLAEAEVDFYRYGPKRALNRLILHLEEALEKIRETRDKTPSN